MTSGARAFRQNMRQDAQVWAKKENDWWSDWMDYDWSDWGGPPVMEGYEEYSDFDDGCDADSYGSECWCVKCRSVAAENAKEDYLDWWIKEHIEDCFRTCDCGPHELRSPWHAIVCFSGRAEALLFTLDYEEGWTKHPYARAVCYVDGELYEEEDPWDDVFHVEQEEECTGQFLTCNCGECRDSRMDLYWCEEYGWEDDYPECYVWWRKIDRAKPEKKQRRENRLEERMLRLWWRRYHHGRKLYWRSWLNPLRKRQAYRKAKRPRFEPQAPETKES